MFHQIDVVSSFHNGDLLEEVFMNQPKGFIKDKGLVCKLHKSMYGLKQASRAWYQRIDKFPSEMGMKMVESHHIIYSQITLEENLIIATYVDDLLLVGNNFNVIEKFNAILNNEFKMKDLGEAKFNQGIKIKREGIPS